MTPSSSRADRHHTKARWTSAASLTLPAGPDYWPVPPQPTAKERSSREREHDEQREEATEQASGRSR